MGHENRIVQLENLRNIETNADFYEKLASGKIATTQSAASSHSDHDGVATNGPAQPYYIPVPITIKSQIGSPTALAIGAFATTLTTLSLALMGFRGVSVTNAFIGDFFGVAGIGMFVSANWELVLGNTYAYTVLAAFGLFYAGFGFIITPSFGVAESYGGANSAEYNNAVGFFVLMWAVWNLFFLLGSLPINLVYIGIFFTVQMAFTLVAAAYFLTADGLVSEAKAVNKAAGAFAFASGMLGYYTVANLMCQESIHFSFPMGDTSRFFRKKTKKS
ncbi:acetate transporter [Lecanosticta acicola]|uniref:Acetate transporter n=1 Tax=Lecanosticta acicola TaxID=111012 RepID=A0AAI8W1K8_9PEZI|nr:acetate transporter [Lecanosticta acicola]